MLNHLSKIRRNVNFGDSKFSRFTNSEKILKNDNIINFDAREAIKIAKNIV